MGSTLNSGLVEAACDGDTEAMEMLLCECQPSITRFARRYCATAEDAEDAVQETLWMIYRRIGSLRSSAAFASWTFQIVRHYCYKLLAPFRHQADELDDMLLDAIDADAQPELIMDLQRDVADAIRRLPAAYRPILILRDVEGYSATEVAAMLGITVETVKSRLHRGRGMLREMLASWIEGEKVSD